MLNIHDGSFTIQRKKNLSFLWILILGEMQYKVWINSITYRKQGIVCKNLIIKFKWHDINFLIYYSRWLWN